jgi:HEPN domain-containing protein
MLTRTELLKIKRARLKDAKILYQNRQYDGAVYICGYAVEIALKARICKTLKWIDGYPDTRKEFENYTSFKTHDLDVLLRISGIEEQIKKRFFSEWSTIAKWNPEARYKEIGKINKIEAGNMIQAAWILAGVI